MTHGARRPAPGRAIGDLAARLRRSERGQSLTELALVLPILLLLTVIALDFGRIYLGWINVQNMARIAANYAANNPTAWGTAPDTSVQLRYKNQVIEDMAATNCVLPTSGGNPVVPAPAFTDSNLDGTTGGLGDIVKVQISCRFSVATPIIAGILGGSVQVTAESNFPVKAGMTTVIATGAGGSGGGGIAAPPTAAFMADNSVFTVPDPIVTYTVVGPDTAVDFRDASGGGPATDFRWRVSDTLGTQLSETDGQDLRYLFHCPAPDADGGCTYLVAFQASNAYGQGNAWMYVRVTAPPKAVDFFADDTTPDIGQLVTLANTSTPGGTAWEWFLNGVSIGTGQTLMHAFNVVGTYTVRLVVTYPTETKELTRTDYITVSVPYCTVPSLTNVKFNSASDIWRGATYRFTGTVKAATGAPNGNFTITAQSIAAGNGATALCTSDVYVSSP